MSISKDDLKAAIRQLELCGRPVCVHSSLSSFGRVNNGPEDVVAAFLEEGCTLLVPTFSWDRYGAHPPPGFALQRNGWGEYTCSSDVTTSAKGFTTSSHAIDTDMGAIPSHVISNSKRMRGNHPLCSFSALGPLASDLVENQSFSSVFAPLENLARLDGYVALLGVDLRKMTLLHLAEVWSGRQPFCRWAVDHLGKIQTVDVGGCSEGFQNLWPHLAPLAKSIKVGSSDWTVFPAARTLDEAAKVIQTRPQITHCGDSDCERCRDAVAGGPQKLEG